MVRQITIASRSLLCAALLLAVLAAFGSPRAAVPRASDGTPVDALADSAVLREVVAPDGEMLSVRARLFRVASGIRMIDSSQTLTAPWVRPVGPDAVVVTRSTRLWGQSHGASVAGLTLRVTRLYVRRNGAWRLLFQQGTPLADEHVAGIGPGAPPH